MPYYKSNKPNLPKECPVFTATASTGDSKLLEDHFEDLPGLNRDRVDHLSNKALREKGGGAWGKGPGSTVLSINDLLREQVTGLVALHPEVVQVVPIEHLDPLLEAIGEMFGATHCDNAYLYPDYLAECQQKPAKKEALYPPDYHINAADLARGLRANDVLVSVRQPSESRLGSNRINSILDGMNIKGEMVSASVTIYQPEEALEPYLLIDKVTNHPNSPSEKQLRDLCFTLFHRNNILLEVVQDTNG